MSSNLISEEAAAEILSGVELPPQVVIIAQPSDGRKVVYGKLGNKWLNVVACRKPSCYGRPFESVISKVLVEEGVIEIDCFCRGCETSYIQPFKTQFFAP